MGYYASGEFEITKSQLSETEFVLDFARFITELGREYQLSDFRKDPSDSLFEGVCRLGEWEPLSKETNAEGFTTCRYNFSDKWRGGNSYEEAFFRYCASVGMVVQGEFVGEDNESWGYDTTIATRKLRIVSYTRVDSEVLSQMKQDIKTLGEIETLCKADLEPTDSLEQIKAKFIENHAQSLPTSLAV